MAYNGNNIIIMLDGQRMAAVKTHSVSTQSEAIEVSSANDGEWKHYRSGRKEWSLTVNYLVLSDGESNITDLLKAGSTYPIVSRQRNGQFGVTGRALCTQCEQVYTRGNLCTGRFSFKGTGSLNSTT